MSRAGLSSKNFRDTGASAHRNVALSAAGHESELAQISSLLATPPPDGRKHWTQALLSRELGISYYLVRKVMISTGLTTGSNYGHPRRTASSPTETVGTASDSADNASSAAVSREA
ncbi:MAG: hypothetical protein LBT40_07525 [Deltaproteobacteria bacterium]|jgi:hypothetical protein|nr:hypothetical protein [Deltaproteobacteria bacterium]